MLQKPEFNVSKTQVCQLLHEMKYHLSGNRKAMEGGNNPDRNTRFEFINEQSKKFLKLKYPVISVDAQKKGQGNRKIQHPFSCSLLSVPSEVGMDHDTAEFAVESICRWWKHWGQGLYHQLDWSHDQSNGFKSVRNEGSEHLSDEVKNFG